MFWEWEKFSESHDVVAEFLVIRATSLVKQVAEEDDGVRTDVTICQRKGLLKVFVRIESGKKAAKVKYICGHMFQDNGYLGI